LYATSRDPLAKPNTASPSPVKLARVAAPDWPARAHAASVRSTQRSVRRSEAAEATMPLAAPPHPEIGSSLKKVSGCTQGVQVGEPGPPNNSTTSEHGLLASHVSD